jgi:hypothetical protein
MRVSNGGNSVGGALELVDGGDLVALLVILLASVK